MRPTGGARSYGAWPRLQRSSEQHCRSCTLLGFLDFCRSCCGRFSTFCTSQICRATGEGNSLRCVHSQAKLEAAHADARAQWRQLAQQCERKVPGASVSGELHLVCLQMLAIGIRPQPEVIIPCSQFSLHSHVVLPTGASVAEALPAAGRGGRAADRAAGGTEAGSSCRRPRGCQVQTQAALSRFSLLGWCMHAHSAYQQSRLASVCWNDEQSCEAAAILHCPLYCSCYRSDAERGKQEAAAARRQMDAHAQTAAVRSRSQFDSISDDVISASRDALISGVGCRHRALLIVGLTRPMYGACMMAELVRHRCCLCRRRPLRAHIRLGGGSRKQLLSCTPAGSPLPQTWQA
jgi:hypothetical protein